MLCAVCGCNNYNNKTKKVKREDISYFHFPKDPKLLKKWLNFCKRKDVFNTRTARICSDHFTPDDMERNLQFELGFMSRKRLRLKPGSVPSVYTTADEDDASRIVSRKRKKIVADSPNESTIETDTENEDDELDENEDEEECFETNVSLQMVEDLDPIDINSCENCASLKTRLKVLSLRMNAMEEKCNRVIRSETELKNRIKSLELELKQSKMSNIINETNSATISKDVPIEGLKSATEPKQERYSKVDITSSKVFYTANSKAYNLLRKKGVPLPSERTLQRWAHKKNVSS